MKKKLLWILAAFGFSLAVDVRPLRTAVEDLVKEVASLYRVQAGKTYSDPGEGAGRCGGGTGDCVDPNPNG